MASDVNKLQIKLEAQSTKFTAEMKKAQKEVDKLKGKTKKAEKEFGRFRISTAGVRRSLGALRNNMLLVTFAFGGTLGAVKKLIGAYAQQQLAEKKLSAALGFTSEALLNQASALQQQTAFGDEAIIGVQALIGAFTKDEEQIKSLTKTTLDLAAAKGMDLTAAADLVSKSFGSSTNALSRYGIVVEGVEGSTERLEMLTENVAELFGGQAKEQADTMAGSMAQMKNAVGDTAENLGRFLEPAVISLSSSLKTAAEGVGEFFLELSESSLETSLRHLQEMGVAAEDLMGLQFLVNREQAQEELDAASEELAKFWMAQTGNYADMSKNLSTEVFRNLGVAVKEEAGVVNDALNSFLQHPLLDEKAKIKWLDRDIKKLDLLNISLKDIDKELDKQYAITVKLAAANDMDAAKRESMTKVTKGQIEMLFDLKKILTSIHTNHEALNKDQKEYIEGQKNQETEEERIMRLQTEAFNKFVEQQEKKNKAHKIEQDFIEKLQTQYPELASDLDLLTDAQKDKNKADEEALKLEEQQTENFQGFLDSQRGKIDTIEEFTIAMGEKHIADAIEQDLLAQWIENNKDLAKELGIVTKAQQKLDDAEKALGKTREEEGMNFLKNLKDATAGSEKYAAIYKAAAISEVTINTSKAMMAAYNAYVGIPLFGTPLAVAAASAAGIAGAVQIDQIRKAEHGMNEVVDEPTLILAGEAGAEHVGITPLESPNLEGVQGGGITVNVSGNILTSDFVEGELAEQIREAVRRGTDFGIG